MPPRVVVDVARHDTRPRDAADVDGDRGGSRHFDVYDRKVGIPDQHAGAQGAGRVAEDAKPREFRVLNTSRHDGRIGFRRLAWQANDRGARDSTDETHSGSQKQTLVVFTRFNDDRRAGSGALQRFGNRSRGADEDGSFGEHPREQSRQAGAPVRAKTQSGERSNDHDGDGQRTDEPHSRAGSGFCWNRRAPSLGRTARLRHRRP